ncbi:MAG TPA: terminase [Acetobacteraceae bacterium]|nr:terminase [Acetobacteraceae bacterium]
MADEFAQFGAMLADYQLDPLGFVRACYPWGEPGELEGIVGPREWQADVLRDIGERLNAGYEPGAAMMPVLKAIASGHGPGKSALLAWLAWWAISTMVDARAMVTANTEQQLRTRTWPEIVKWTRRAINLAMFKVQGLSIESRVPGHERNWRCDAVTWSEHNLVAFQGLHNASRRIVLLYEEASGIADPVWATSEGSLTDANTEIIWLVIGNPTEPTGRFFECFGREKYRWHGKQIDSRTVPGTNVPLFAEWVRLYGEDHDFVRVRVRGLFPRSGSMQFIGSDLVEAACNREPVALVTDPLIIGVDVARFGDDQSVIWARKGRDARTIPPIKMRGVDTMQLAGRVAECVTEWHANAVFVDGGGVGGGVVDRLRQLNVAVVEVQFGAKSDRVSMTEERPAYANKRAEIWGNMREWLGGGSIPDDPEVRADMTGTQYAFIVKDGRDSIQLERKRDIKLRGLSSPDCADALALTFAYPVMPRAAHDAGRLGFIAQPESRGEYDPFAEFNLQQPRGY